MENTSKFPAAPDRRAVLAFIALADIPVPNEVNFHDQKSLFLRVDTAAEVQAWAALLGLQVNDVVQSHDDGKEIHSASAFGISGWYVNVTAYTPSGATTGLDVETGVRLSALLNEVSQ